MQITEIVQMPIKSKRRNGVYYTTDNPFKLRPFKQWAKMINLENNTILEPFAGANNIIKMLQKEKLCNSFSSFDISPRDKHVTKRDTLQNFPTGYNTCITNPPWLTNYSAKRRGVHFPKIQFDNIYKHCLKLTLDNCENVAFIVPGTYVRTNLFRDRLHSVIFVNSKLFSETDNPVCVALFVKKAKSTKIYYDDKFIGKLEDIEKIYPIQPYKNTEIVFNAPDGVLGLFCIDNTKEPTIRFCRGDEINRYVKHSDRLITRIKCNIKDIDETVSRLNKALNEYRTNTHDVLLAPFKGLRKDGQYRRRLDYDTARMLIEKFG